MFIFPTEDLYEGMTQEIYDDNNNYKGSWVYDGDKWVCQMTPVVETRFMAKSPLVFDDGGSLRRETTDKDLLMKFRLDQMGESATLFYFSVTYKPGPNGVNRFHFDENDDYPDDWTTLNLIRGHKYFFSQTETDFMGRQRFTIYEDDFGVLGDPIEDDIKVEDDQYITIFRVPMEGPDSYMYANQSGDRPQKIVIHDDSRYDYR